MSGLGDSAAGAIDALLSRLRMIRSSDPAERRTGIITAAVALLFSCCACGWFLQEDGVTPEDDAGGIQPLVSTVAPTDEPDEPPIEEPATPTPRPSPTERPTATDLPAATEAPPTATAPPTIVPPTAVPTPAFPYDPPPEEDRNCADFAGTGTDPQAWWNARRSDSWPNPGGLDGDGDGSVCEQGEGGIPAAPPPPPAPAADQPSRPCDTSLTCDDFGSWSEMNAWWNACGRPEQYDRNGDGVPCEGLR